MERTIIFGLGCSLFLLVGCSTQPSEEEMQTKVSNERIISTLPDSVIAGLKDKTDDPSLKEHMDGNVELWSYWKQEGIDVTRPFTIDFYYYSASKEETLALQTKLESIGLVTSIFPERTMLVLEGWKIKTQIRRVWNLNVLQEYTKGLYFIGEETGPYLEGLGTLSEK